MTTPRYRNDSWNLADEFGLAQAGDVVARIALDAEPPFSMGVVGKWGSGKTSVMRRAFATLKGRTLQQDTAFGESLKETKDAQWEKLGFDFAERKSPLNWDEDLRKLAGQCLPIWYSPWQHQNEVNPLVPLLGEIRAQFNTCLTAKGKLSDINRRGGYAALKVLEYAADAVASLGTGKNMKIARGLSDDVRKAWQGDEADLLRSGDGQRFHLLFDDAVKNLLSSVVNATAESNGDIQLHEQARMIVFIDDLDRCEEATVVQLLEAVKLYLGSQHCVFVMGMDDAAVQGAIGRYWKRSDEDNRDYLDKLFQLTVPVPHPRPGDIRQQVASQFEQIGMNRDVAKSCAQDVTRLMEPNPRKIKNFVNALCAGWCMSHRASWDDDATKWLVLMYYLRLYHRPVWRILERQPETFGLLAHVLNDDAGF